MNTTKELFNVSKIVKQILREDQEARDNDDYLYCKVCERVNAISVNEPFNKVMRNRKDLGFPPFETVRRTRQKLQEEYPELEGTVKKQRLQNTVAYKGYAKSEV